ncbi:MAG TPA: 1-(5-phosphoribosyl)-5-[(5-phosphoribosylamino)methylideneamino] imidazole-4-carboxamide isomerase [Steroidobacteraceae bacterium]|nr:1-(5-phosphoribosyl)-5-[(5-phosphoribosylamino)methylideneamino] imidazole-4-carboxamide isomerase [Steroidobacteraceae bacterium]
MLLIPAMDLRGGHCVRLFQGDFAAETRYELTPEQLLERYRAWGAQWLHVVDLDGARSGVLANRAIVLGLAARGLLRLQVGGGLRSTEVLEDLLDAGIERVVVGSAAVEDPTSVIQWLGRFGAERLCLAFDVHLVRGEPRVRTRGWQEGGAVSLWDAIEPFRALGLRHVLCTDIERDGALSGPNLELYRRARTRLPELAWQASGGVRDAADLHALAALGVHAAISGKALLEQRIPLKELQPFLPNASSPASTSATGKS